MLLNYVESGDSNKPAIITLHGLLGSLRNWSSAARAMSEHFRVISADARNHGSSFHAASHTFDDMVDDVLDLMDHLGLDSAHLMGHSMGGKAAMRLACRYPERVNHLFVIDTAPKDYPNLHEAEFEAMNALDLSKLQSRNEADAVLEEYLEDWAFRQFLISNIVRGDDGVFTWQINLPVIEEYVPVLSENALELDDSFEGPVHFLIGGKSHYVEETDVTDIRFHFPKVSFDLWEDSGHNPHFEHRNRFVEWVKRKLKV